MTEIYHTNGKLKAAAVAVWDGRAGTIRMSSVGSRAAANAFSSQRPEYIFPLCSFSRRTDPWHCHKCAKQQRTSYLYPQEDYLAPRRPTSSSPNSKMSSPVHVLFGTVTGNAEEIARRIHAELPSRNLPQGKILCLSDYSTVPHFSQSGPPAQIVIVVSTTGEGDPPESIRPFMRLLRKKDRQLPHLSYTVLALGDTNYENFCNTGKRIDAAMEKLGARRFYKRGDADDGTGLELVVEPWLEALWPALEKAVAAVPAGMNDVLPETDVVVTKVAEIEKLVQGVTVQELGFDEKKLPKVFPPKLSASFVDVSAAAVEPPVSVSQSFVKDSVRSSRITAAKLLTAPDADKAVWHMEVSCDEQNRISRTYRPGDAFGVIVENDSQEVERFLKALGVEGNAVLRVVNVNGREIAMATVKQFVAQRIDLRAVPKKALLRCMSDYCSDIEERKALLYLCSRDGRKKYSEELVNRNMSIVQVLEQKACSCKAPISLFLDQLPCVAPRWYSATSSPELDGSSVLQFAFSVVENGLATNSLARSCQSFLNGQRTRPILLIPRESDSKSNFRPPPSLETDYIMIGPGTGVAPFRGFLRERAARLEKEVSAVDAPVGKTILFFGCRYAEKDFLYREDLQQLEAAGTLTSLDVAISRAGPEKVYVQHRLETRSKEVAEVIQGGGRVYVCGDGGGMAQSVHKTLGNILAEHCCEGNDEEGMNMLRKLVDEQRYVRDIWYYGKDDAE